jgi:hypothetical protein
MIDNDQSTIIEAPEEYKSIPTHSPSRNQQQKKMSTLTPFQFYWTKLSGYHIHTKYCKFDHSETILGPFKKLTFLGPDPLPKQLTLKHIDWESTIAKLAVVDASFLFKSRSF